MIKTLKRIMAMVMILFLTTAEAEEIRQEDKRMANYREDIVSIDLECGNIHRSFMRHTIGEGDKKADRFGVRVFRNRVPVQLSGGCIGLFVRADGQTVTISEGVVFDNVAYVELPASCYAVEGVFSLAIKVTEPNDTVTLRIVDGVVSRTRTDVIVDPGTILPSIEDLIDAINAAIASIPPDYSGLVTDVETRKPYIEMIQKNAENGYQFLKESTAVDGEFWFINSNNEVATYEEANCKRYLPIMLYAGIKYTFMNVYGYFTVFTALDGVTSIGRLTENQTNEPYTAEYTPAHDCYAFVTRHKVEANELRQPTMLLLGDIKPDVYTEGIFERDFIIKADSCREFVHPAYQLLEESKSVDNSCWNWSSDDHIGVFAADSTKRYQRVKLKAGHTYTIWNAYGYFTILCDYDGNVIDRLTESASNDPVTKTITPESDCYVYVTIHKGFIGNKHAMVTDSAMEPAVYTEGIYDCGFEKNIVVKTDGSGDYDSVVDAVNVANAFHGSYPVNIYIHTGVYDILEELGGQDFIDSLDDWTYELQGLRIQRDNVNLIGVGYPQLVFRLPGTVTRQQSERCSCLNLTYYSARVENLVLIAKNCRYVIHDEGNNYTIPIHRVMKNLRCVHEGNAAGLWPYPSVLGGGNTGGSTYDIINCQFITDNYMQALSYHCNSAQEPSRYNVDGCVGIVNSSDGISFRFSYMGTATPTGNVVVNLKNCSGNARVVVEPEISGNPDDTPNIIELYTNGYETLQ